MHQARIEFPVKPVPVAFPEPASRRALAARLAVAARPRHDYRCLECDGAFQSVERHAEFCCTKCRKDWNNRRAARGAEIYDLFMALRFERGPAKLAQVWTLLCAVASAYRDADKAKRDGRRSWRRLRNAIADIPMAYGSAGDGR